MLELPGVKDAAIAVRVAANEDKVLFGLIVPQGPLSNAEESTFGHSVREALKSHLSDAMVPARIVLCDALPYLPNGKLDRKAIAALELNTQAETSSSLRDAGLWETDRLYAGLGALNAIGKLGESGFGRAVKINHACIRPCGLGTSFQQAVSQRLAGKQDVAEGPEWLVPTVSLQPGFHQ